MTSDEVPRMVAFLERHVETSLFLLSNLEVNGHELGAAHNSANFQVLEESGRIVGVCALSRRGNLLVQAGDRHELGAVMGARALQLSERDGLPWVGVLGPWETASAAWQVALERPGLVPTMTSREPLFSLDLASVAPPSGGGRALAEDDFDAWVALVDAYAAEERLPKRPGTLDERRRQFAKSVAERRVWGCDADGGLRATAGLNAHYQRLGQVGGVFTSPAYRCRGLCRQAMSALLWDAARVHRFERMILFTGENNLAARRVYESLGFDVVGTYALLFGEMSSTSR